MNVETFEMVMVMEKIPKEVVKEGMTYAKQSGIELRFTPNPTQEDLDVAIAEAWIYGHKAHYDKMKAALKKPLA